ncbi:hypothetical protein B484DRAFT_423792, partial [Ochromonadaceae sp. CCMP2298]
MTEENKLSFSTNGLGVVLSTRHGQLRFTTEEYSYYQSLFKVADVGNCGKLSLLSAQLNSLLVRADTPAGALEKALVVVNRHRNDATSTEGSEGGAGAGGEGDWLSLAQWLMLCKMVACHQETKRSPSDKMLKNLHTGKIKIPFVDFHLSEAPARFASGTYYLAFQAVLSEWAVTGNDFQNQHVKFRIVSSARLVSDRDGEGLGGGGG